MVLRPDWILEKEQSIAKTMFMISTSFIEIFFKFPVLDLIIIVLNRFASFNDLCLISHVLPGCKLKILKLDFLFYQTLQNYFSTSAQHTCRWGVLQTGWVCFISLEALYSCCFTAWRVRQSHENLLLGILNSTVMLLSRINTSFLLIFAISEESKHSYLLLNYLINKVCPMLSNPLPAALRWGNSIFVILYLLWAATPAFSIVLKTKNLTQ